MNLFLLIFFGILAGASIMALIGELRQLKNSQNDLSNRLEKLENKNRLLEESGPKKVNYRYIEALEHAAAAYSSMGDEIDALTKKRENFEFWFDAARNGGKK